MSLKLNFKGLFLKNLNGNNKNTLRNIIGREGVKILLRPMLRWSPLEHHVSGYTIMLGAPWDLRHLLSVNLDFVSRTDLTNCHCIHVVFDRRRQPGYENIISEIQKKFPQLPLSFSHYARMPGFIVEKVNVSTFFNSLNCATVLPKIQTKYAILHDFDLYPLVPEYFESVYRTITDNGWHFCGLERTNFDGLTNEDNVFGTWCLGMDVQWLRSNFSPIDIFHRVQLVGDRLINLDPFSSLELRTSRRGPINSLNGEACCHVKNLCSTFLRFSTGRPAKIVWRLHYLWYLEYISNEPSNFHAAIDAMERAESSILNVGNYIIDFAGTDPTCANVLRDELERMELVLHGQTRPKVMQYLEAFSKFLKHPSKEIALIVV